MNKQVKKALCAVLSLAMVAGSVVLPTMASADAITPLVAGDTVTKEWKFDFGATGATPEEGFTLVTPDTNFVTNTSGTDQYGFLGTGEDDYKLSERYDGWATQKGQVIELTAGGPANSDAIGVTGAGGDGDNEGKDIYGNKADEYYPTRFALKVPDETYYRVKATVTTLDPTKEATASLYTERKHPMYTDKTIAAGTTETTTFSVRVTPIYYEKSIPTGSISDQMLTVGVLGENAALASLEIQQVETIPTVWVLGDSTVTDGNAALPFFHLQNYTGVGTGLTKYLPRNYAMVNEGEGGLNAADSNHFNMVSSRIKEGDYMYVEYGHNHKSDGPAGYKNCLDKYYNACHSKGAKLLIVSPVQSDNSWNETTHRWNDRFGGDSNFEGAGRSYVEEKVAAGATDIAFVNLTRTSVAFVDKVTVDNGESKTAAQFYYQTSKGGGTDPSHPNDRGAENFAYCAFEAMKDITDATQKAVVQPLIDGMTTEMPVLVSQEIMAGGVGGSAWPIYIVPTSNKYPVVIKDVKFNNEGHATSVDVLVQDAEIPFVTYGIIVITVYDEDGVEKGKIYAVDQVDHSTGKGPQTIVNFSGDVTLAEGDTYDAVVVEADESTGHLEVAEDGAVYSAVYKPTDIDEQLLLNEDEDGNEDFTYFGATYDGETSSLNEYNGWGQIGSAGITSFLNKQGEGEDAINYVTLTSDGAKNGSAGQGSFYYAKNLSKAIGTSGRYLISADMQIVSGGGLTWNLVTGHSDKKLGGTAGIELLSVGAEGKVTAGGSEVGTISATGFTNVKYELDTDLGTATVTVGGEDPVTFDLNNYKTTSTEVTPETLTQFMFGGSKVAFEVKVANMVVAKLKDKKLPQYTATVENYHNERGTVELIYATPTPEPTAVSTAAPTTEASPVATTEASPVATTEASPVATTEASPVATVEASPAATTEASPAATTAASLSSDDTPVIAYNEHIATVTYDKAGTLAFYEVQYNEDNTLKSLKKTDLTFEDAGSKEVTGITEGSTLMLWDDMTPITAASVQAITATYESQSEKLDLNTVVTAKATAKPGFVFTAWLDKNGQTVSTDDEYSFRLRDDIVLTAQFDKEGGVEDITSYNLTADKTRMAVGTAQTVNMTVSDVLDAKNNPVKYNADTDITWSCSDSAITVDKGVVTIPASYTSADTKKTVTVTSTINDISKSVNLTLYSCEMFEDFSEVANYSDYISDTGTAKTMFGIVDTATDKASFTGMTSIGNGKVLVMGNQANGAGSMFTYEKDLGLASHTTLKFGFDIEPFQIRTDGKSSAVTLQFVDSEGTKVFDINIATGGTAAAPANSSFNGTAVTGFVRGEVMSVDTELDFTNHTMKYALTNRAGTVVAQGTADITAKDLSKMKFSGDWQYGKFAIDNVYADYTSAE